MQNTSTPTALIEATLALVAIRMSKGNTLTEAIERVGASMYAADPDTTERILDALLADADRAAREEERDRQMDQAEDAWLDAAYEDRF